MFNWGSIALSGEGILIAAGGQERIGRSWRISPAEREDEVEVGIR